MQTNPKKLSDFKALLFDIDRTLTNTKREIFPETIDALNKLAEKGYQIGVCSGRGVASIKNKILPLFPKNSFHITTGGSQLVSSEGKVIWDNPINSQTIESIRKYFDNLKLDDNSKTNSDSKPGAVFMKEDAQYAKEPTLTNLKNHPWNVVAKNLNEMDNSGVGLVYMFNINDKIVDYVKNDPNLSFKSMTDNFDNPYIDVTAKGINKAITLKKWSEHMGIPTDKIIGFGDSPNDIEFLEACGFSVVMGNGEEEIKQIADRIIGHTDDNSLSKYLSKIIQGEDL